MEDEEKRFTVSWDNPLPADSSGMLKDLRRLGRVVAAAPKTTIVLRTEASWRDLRRVVVRNLDPRRGNAVYANSGSDRSFHYGRATGFHWKEIAR